MNWLSHEEIHVGEVANVYVGRKRYFLLESRHEKTCLRGLHLVGLKLACSATEASTTLEILDLASIINILST